TVEGVNIQKRHTKPSRTNPTGGVIEQPGPIHVSNVMLVCPSCNEAVKVRRDRSEEGAAGRSCKSCGKSID
ncbi:MAG TPA: 50S ribosomal protein L24, partial [Limnochordia bacterium]|nr:50S ribosomal protein L24 [Limnochordia bacterium]